VARLSGSQLNCPGKSTENARTKDGFNDGRTDVSKYSKAFKEQNELTIPRTSNEIENLGTPKSYSQGLDSREATEESSEPRELFMKQDQSRDSTSLQLADAMPFTLPSKEIVSEAISLYFRYCHKQPLWLLDPEDLASPETCRNEILFGVLTLALPYSDNPLIERRKDQMCRQYAESARGLVMFRIAQGSVDLSTMQSLCLIALAEYIGVINCP